MKREACRLGKAAPRAGPRLGKAVAREELRALAETAQEPADAKGTVLLRQLPLVAGPLAVEVVAVIGTCAQVRLTREQ